MRDETLRTIEPPAMRRATWVWRLLLALFVVMVFAAIVSAP